MDIGLRVCRPTFRLSSFILLTRVVRSATTAVERFSAITSCCPARSLISFSISLNALVAVNW